METPHHHHHRRDFVRAAIALVAPAAAVGADDPKSKPKPQEEPAKSEADARMELVLARYGKQLDDDARKKVRGEVEAIVRRAEALRRFALDNGDGPFPVFHPYRTPIA